MAFEDLFKNIARRTTEEALRPDGPGIEAPQAPEATNLDDGTPVFYAFIDRSVLNSGRMTPEQRNDAIDMVRDIAHSHPDAIKNLAGKTIEEARMTLAPYAKEIEDERSADNMQKAA